MNVESAEGQLDNAESKFKHACRLYGKEANDDPSSVLTLSQRCIEHSAKTIFTLFGVQVPTEHSISLDSEPANQLLNAVYDEMGEEACKRTGRLIFLTQIYGNAYPESEYGVEIGQTRLEANDFLDRMEGDQAYNHADEAIGLARDLLDNARRREGMDQIHREDLFQAAHEYL